MAPVVGAVTHVAPNVVPNATLCLSSTYADPFGDAGMQDADRYGIGYDCSSKLWAVVAHDPTGGVPTLTQDFSIFVNRDRNDSTGCSGTDVVATVFWDSSTASWVTGAINTPDCNTSDWTVRAETVVVSSPDSDTIGLAFPNSVVNAATFNWRLAWDDLNNVTDYMPDSGWKTTTTPVATTDPIAAHVTFNCAIQSTANHRYVSSELLYTGTLHDALRARSTSVGAWEKFQCVAIGTNQWAIKSRANGAFVSTELLYGGNYYATLRARSSSIGAWEKYTITKVASCSCYAIRSAANSRYVSAELLYTGSAYGLLRARAASPGTWEHFAITKTTT
jgi:hypothetical protein